MRLSLKNQVRVKLWVRFVSWLSPALVFILLLAGNLSMWRRTNDLSDSLARYQSRNTAEQVALRLENLLHERTNDLAFLAGLWLNYPEPERITRFLTDATRIVKQEPAYHVINYVDTQSIIRASVPPGKQPELVGLDLKTLPGRGELHQQVRDTGISLASPPMTLTTGRPGMVIWFPILGAEDDPIPFDGMVAGTFYVDDIIRRAVTASALAEFWVCIEIDGTLVYSSEILEAGPAQRMDSMGATKDIYLLGQLWRVSVYPRPESTFAQLPRENMARFGLNIVLSLLVSVMLGVAVMAIERVRKSRQQLRQGELRLKTMLDEQSLLLDTMDAHVWYLTDMETYGITNRAHAAFLGFRREDIEYKRLKEFLPPEVTLVCQQSNRQVFETREMMHTEEWISNVEGEERLFAITKTPKLDQNGDVAYVVCVGMDITERQQAEEALQKSEALHRALFEQASDAIFIENENDEILDANRRACELLGYTREELLAMRVSDLQAPEIRNRKGAVISHELEQYQGAVFEGINLHRSGTRVPVEISTARVRGLEGGLVLSVVRDITERKRAEQERESLVTQIRKQARRLEQILSTVPAGVVLLDAEGRVLQANPVAESALAMLAGAKVGDSLTYLGNRSLVELLTSPPTKGTWHEVTIKLPSGERTFEAITRPVENGPEPEHWVLVIKDVTREREIQVQLQQQERLAAVGQLAAGIAHDFNNIMAVIMLYAQMGLRATDTSSKLRERLEIVTQQARRATDLIQQILDFSRQAVLERRPVNLIPFLKEVVKLLERTLPENINIDLTCGADEYIVNADLTRLQQAMMNLVVNARDAMPEGGALQIDLFRSSETNDARCVICGGGIEGEWLRLRVTDTGAGIPSDVLPHIFEPFFTTKEVGKGSGLGLAQVYGIVAQHEAHISVTTEIRKGTTFAVYLPELRAHQLEEPATKTSALVVGHGETILLVEDDVALRMALVDSLKSQNYCVLEAANGREALNMLEKHAGEVSLVLSDLVMPEMGGQALFHAIQQRGLTLPVVLLSGHPMENELENLQAQGLAGWMLKPPDIEQLSQLLARAIRGKGDPGTPDED